MTVRPPLSARRRPESRLFALGLGSAEAVDGIEVHWPNGVRQTVESPSANQVAEFIEQGR